MTLAIKRSAVALCAALLVITGALSIGQTFAQPAGQQSVSGNGFRVSPVTSELIVEAGQSETFTITIENPTESATTAVPIVNDFVAGDNEDGEALPILDESAPAPRNSFRSLVTQLEPLDLAPGETKELDVIISVPNDANAGGYYGIVRFVPENLNEEGNVTLSASVGSIALVRVPGDLTERVDLVSLSASQDEEQKSFFTGGDVSILTRLRNSGDIHLAPFGKIQIKNMFGDTVESFELNNTTPRANILPDTTRRFVDELDNDSWFGRYTIEANLGYQQGSGEPITAQSTFWYLPVWVLIAVFVGLAAIALGIVSFVNRRGLKKRSKRSKK
jgi:hypothetical protein